MSIPQVEKVFRPAPGAENYGPAVMKTIPGAPTQTPRSYFRLIGQEMIFEVTRRFAAAGMIPSVEGVSLDGASETTARLRDVIFMVRPRIAA